MPLNLIASGVPWAKIKVQTLKMAFNMDGQTGEVGLKDLQLAVDCENAVPGWLFIDNNSRQAQSATAAGAQRQACLDGRLADLQPEGDGRYGL